LSSARVEAAALPEACRAPVEELVRILTELGGSNLLAVTVIAPGTWPLRSVAVFNDVDLNVLNALRHHGAKLGRRRLQAPLIMTPTYIDRSRDAFPLELLEIQTRGVCVLGEDHFAALTFDRRDVRLECEREFKRELITLRQGLLSAGDRSDLFGPLCEAALRQTAVILAGMLWLKNEPVPESPEGVVASASRVLGLPLGGLRAVAAPGADRNFMSFRAVYDDVHALSLQVDALAV